jgi:hypothetical protein
MPPPDVVPTVVATAETTPVPALVVTPATV